MNEEDGKNPPKKGARSKADRNGSVGCRLYFPVFPSWLFCCLFPALFSLPMVRSRRMLYQVSFTFCDAMHVFNVRPSVRYATLYLIIYGSDPIESSQFLARREALVRSAHARGSGGGSESVSS